MADQHHPGIFRIRENANVGLMNAGHVYGARCADAEGLTEATVQGRKMAAEYFEFYRRYIPGFENAFVSVTNAEIGVRETRHIEGMYTLTGMDVYEGRKFEDVVSRGYFPIDLHNPDGKEGYGNGGVWKVPKDTYDIPYRCLIPKHIDGLILSGRCISGTSEAHGSYRTQGGIMGIGQASGIAAAVCAKKHIQPREQEVKEIQEELIRIGASVYRDEEKTKAEKARARKIAQEYIKEHEGNLITLPEILKEYED